MSIFFDSNAQVGDKFGVNAVNSILSLFASDTAPTDPFTDQVWLDTSSTPKILKQWNGSTWIVLFDGYYLTTNEKAADSDKLDGLELHTGRNNEANKVVRTQANGFCNFGWINT